ncbi:MAG TPA: helix-turn-helix domain-containing protein [Rhodanobacteraceae bacterium]|nr:helix-turn-helix domain-containing protein [Rhodanobacteraceae bacterium]
MTHAPPRRIPVLVVVPPRALLLDVAGPLEVLRRAGLEQESVAFDVRYVGPSPTTASSIGLVLAGIGALPASIEDDAIVLVPGSADAIAFADDVTDAAAARDDAAIVDWLRQRVRATHLLISICSGALLAARAGLLDGRDCTTHFSACATLAAIAPAARVIENRLYVVDGARCSSAGVTAGTDLMLHLVAGWLGPAIAAAIARHLVIYLRRSGTDPQLSPWLEGRNHIHPAVHRVQDAIAADPSRAWTLARLAQVASTSARHLSRLFNEHAGMGIPEYVNRLRVAIARELVVETRLDMERVAEQAGFASSRQLRRAWRRSYATPPQRSRDAARESSTEARTSLSAAGR